MTQRNALAAGLLAAVLVLAGCGSAAVAPPDDPFLVEHDLAGLTGQEIVDRLEASDEPRPLAFGASVRETEVLLSDGATEVAVDLPEDRYYVSVAPFVDSTHECYFHSLATCQGELVEVPIQITITDDAGEVLVDDDPTTFTNGFVGYWLPRDLEGTIEVTYDGLSGTVPFSTADGEPTCITTLQLT